MTDRSVRALKVASTVLLSAGVIGSIVLLGYATNIFVASLASATSGAMIAALQHPD